MTSILEIGSLVELAIVERNKLKDLLAAQYGDASWFDTYELSNSLPTEDHSCTCWTPQAWDQYKTYRQTQYKLNQAYEWYVCL